MLGRAHYLRLGCMSISNRRNACSGVHVVYQAGLQFPELLRRNVWFQLFRPGLRGSSFHRRYKPPLIPHFVFVTLCLGTVLQILVLSRSRNGSIVTAFFIGSYCMWNVFSGLLATKVCQSQVQVFHCCHVC